MAFLYRSQRSSLISGRPGFLPASSLSPATFRLVSGARDSEFAAREIVSSRDTGDRYCYHAFPEVARYSHPRQQASIAGRMNEQCAPSCFLFSLEPSSLFLPLHPPPSMPPSCLSPERNLVFVGKVIVAPLTRRYQENCYSCCVD